MIKLSEVNTIFNDFGRELREASDRHPEDFDLQKLPDRFTYLIPGVLEEGLPKTIINMERDIRYQYRLKYGEEINSLYAPVIPLFLELAVDAKLIKLIYEDDKGHRNGFRTNGDYE